MFLNSLFQEYHREVLVNLNTVTFSVSSGRFLCIKCSFKKILLLQRGLRQLRVVQGALKEPEQGWGLLSQRFAPGRLTWHKSHSAYTENKANDIIHTAVLAPMQSHECDCYAKLTLWLWTLLYGQKYEHAFRFLKITATVCLTAGISDSYNGTQMWDTRVLWNHKSRQIFNTTKFSWNQVGSGFSV